MSAVGTGDADLLLNGDSKGPVLVDSPLLPETTTGSHTPHDSVQGDSNGHCLLDLEKKDTSLPAEINRDLIGNGAFPCHYGYHETFIHSDQPPLPRQVSSMTLCRAVRRLRRTRSLLLHLPT